jgi:hypothetical protein
MHLKSLIIAAVVFSATGALAQSTTTGTTGAASGSTGMGASGSVGGPVGTGTPQSPAVAGGNTPNAVAGPNNSTGNMNTKGTGPGTTGTGSKGGSGNQ